MSVLGPAVDIKTVMLMMGVGYFAFGMILLAYRAQGDHRHMLDVWTVVQFLKSAATLFIGLRGTIPDAVSSLGGNGLTFIAFALELLVFRYYVFQQWHMRFVGTIGGLLLAVFLVDALLTSGHAALIVSSGLAVLTLLSGLTLLQAPAPRSALLYTLAAGNLAMAGTAALRTYTLLAVDGASGFSTLLNNQLMFHVAYLLMLINGFGFLLLVKQATDAELRRLSATDTLTGLGNRRSFETLTHQTQRRSRRSGEPNAVMLLDLDHFKNLNDTLGHAAGDSALKAVGALIRQQMRDEDICARLGGEEFAVTLTGVTLSQAVVIADRLRMSMMGIRIAEQSDDEPLVTASAGVTSLHPDEPLGDALTRADRALYEAKDRGRNRVVPCDNAHAFDLLSAET